MQVREVGRWRCEKCGKTCVAAGRKDRRLTRVGIVVGAACPWECGLRINRGFRFVKSTDVTLFTIEAWDRLAFDGTASIPETISVSDEGPRSHRGESAPHRANRANRPGKGSRASGRDSSLASQGRPILARKPLIRHLLAMVAVIGPRLAISRES
jgi:hypothetical protein